MGEYYANEAEAYTFNEPIVGSVKVVEKIGDASECVWCGKMCLIAELDRFGRCQFDRQFPNTDEGKVQSIQVRGEIAIIMIHKGILP